MPQPFKLAACAWPDRPMEWRLRRLTELGERGLPVPPCEVVTAEAALDAFRAAFTL